MSISHFLSMCAQSAYAVDGLGRRTERLLAAVCPEFKCSNFTIIKFPHWRMKTLRFSRKSVRRYRFDSVTVRTRERSFDEFARNVGFLRYLVAKRLPEIVNRDTYFHITSGFQKRHV